MPIRLLIIDDHEIVRLGLRHLFHETDIQIAAEASNTQDAMRRLSENPVDLALVDVRMENGDGLQFLMRARLQYPGMPILMYSAFDNPTYLHQAVALSAAGFLLKTTPKAELLSAIRRAAAGEAIWKREELRRMTGALATPRLKADVEVPLTQRENQVLMHLCDGLTNREIAGKMEISYETVKEHVQHILQKIGVSDRTQAATWAVRNGLA